MAMPNVVWNTGGGTGSTGGGTGGGTSQSASPIISGLQGGGFSPYGDTGGGWYNAPGGGGGSGTSITGPGLATPMSTSQIDQAFGNIYNMLGPTGPANQARGGGNVGPSGLQPQPVSGNTLTQTWQTLSNLAGLQAPGFEQQGQQITGTGLGTTGQGVQAQQQGLQTLNDPIAFYQKLLSGDPSAVTAALAPTAANISNIYGGAMNQASQGMPAGGYRAATMAELPQAQAAQVANAALGLQPAAAQALGGLGQAQAGIGQGIGETGLGVAGVGGQMTNQGLQELQNTISDVLTKMGINIQGSGPAQFNQVASGIGAII